MIPRGTRIGVLAIIGLLTLALSPGVARAQAPAAQDTLNAVIKRGEVIVGTFDFFPPWGFRDAQNNIVGMDVDIAKELASDDVEGEADPRPGAHDAGPDQLPALRQDRCRDLELHGDLAAVQGHHLHRPVRDRRRRGHLPQGGKIKDWTDLNGKRVAVTTGSTGEILLTQQAPQAKLLQLRPGLDGPPGGPAEQGGCPDRGLHLHRVPRRARQEGLALLEQAARFPARTASACGRATRSGSTT